MKPETAIRDRRGIVRRKHSETVIRVDKRGIFRGNSFRLCLPHLVILSFYLGCIFIRVETKICRFYVSWWIIRSLFLILFIIRVLQWFHIREISLQCSENTFLPRMQGTDRRYLAIFCEIPHRIILFSSIFNSYELKILVDLSSRTTYFSYLKNSCCTIYVHSPRKSCTRVFNGPVEKDYLPTNRLSRWAKDEGNFPSHVSPFRIKQLVNIDLRSSRRKDRFVICAPRVAPLTAIICIVRSLHCSRPNPLLAACITARL